MANAYSGRNRRTIKYRFCTRTWNWEDYGVEGIKITSKTNGNSIFFPTAGGFIESDFVGRQQFGYYWSRTLNTGNSSTAFSLTFPGDYTLRYNYERYMGLTIRPVLRE